MLAWRVFVHLTPLLFYGFYFERCNVHSTESVLSFYSSTFCEFWCNWLVSSVMTPPPKRHQTHTNYETVRQSETTGFSWAIRCWWCILNCWLKPLAKSHACTSAGGDWKFRGADVSGVRGGVRREEPLFLDSRSSSSSFIIRTGRAQN